MTTHDLQVPPCIRMDGHRHKGLSPACEAQCVRRDMRPLNGVRAAGCSRRRARALAVIIVRRPHGPGPPGSSRRRDPFCDQFFDGWVGGFKKKTWSPGAWQLIGSCVGGVKRHPGDLALSGHMVLAVRILSGSHYIDRCHVID
jgi:hypothetical protein